MRGDMMAWNHPTGDYIILTIPREDEAEENEDEYGMEYCMHARIESRYNGSTAVSDESVDWSDYGYDPVIIARPLA